GVHRLVGHVGVRLWGPFIAGALVSLAVVAALAAISVDTERRQVAALQRDVARRVAAQLDQYVRLFQDEVASLVEVLPPIIEDEEAQRLLLQSATSKLDSSIYRLSVVGVDGWERVKAIQGQPRPRDFEDLSGDAAFRAALAGDNYFGPAYTNPTFNYPAVDLAFPVRDTMGGLLAVLRAEIDLSTMWSLVSARDASVGEQGYVYVTDARGRLLAHYDVSRLRVDPQVDDLPQVAEAQRSATPSPTASEYPTGLEGAPVLAYYLPVDVGESAWLVIVEQPLGEAYAQANTFGLIGLGLSVTTVVAISIMGLYIRRRIAHPIEALRRGAAALAAGDLHYRIQIDTGDELEFLAQEFNDMSATLQQSQTRLAAIARQRGRQAEEAQGRLREMTALIQSGRAITSLDLQDVLSRLAYEAARAVQGDRCSIYVLDAKQRRFVLRGEWDAPTASGSSAALQGAARSKTARGGPEQPLAAAPSNGAVTFEWHEGIVGWVAREGKPIFLANAQADTRFLSKAANDGEVAALI
ncbi:MAG: cache domain-containing protein, partial [Dongiaceae bacterium]